MNTNQNKRNLALTSEHLFITAVLALVLVQFWGYLGAEWTIETSQWSTRVTAEQLAKNNLFMIGIRYVALAVIISLAVSSCRFSRREVFGVFLLFALCIVHTAIKFMDVDLVLGLYQSNVPLQYLLLLSFWIGKNERFWKKLETIIPPLLFAYIAGFLISFISAFSANGWAIYRNCSLMNFYSHTFAVALPFFYIRLRERKLGAVIYLLLIFLVVGAVIIRSRSWLLQSVALVLCVGTTLSRIRGNSISRMVRSVLAVPVVVTAVLALFNTPLRVFWDSFVEKGTVDSRSFQYTEMLQQTQWYQWIFGKGADATYVSSLYGDYQFIDNEFFYLSFHYGVIFAWLYFLPFLRTFLACMRVGRKQQLAYFAAICVFLWVLSVNGMSVFHRIAFDAKAIIIPAFMGYLYTNMKYFNKGAKVDEDPVCGG